MSILETIKDEQIMNRIKRISAEKDWPLELAAVAVKAGDGADKTIESAISAVVKKDIKKAAEQERLKSIELLREKYRQAMQDGNVGAAISLKMRLHKEFGVYVGYRLLRIVLFK